MGCGVCTHKGEGWVVECEQLYGALCEVGNYSSATLVCGFVEFDAIDRPPPVPSTPSCCTISQCHDFLSVITGTDA